MTDFTKEDLKPGDRYEYKVEKGKGAYGIVGEYFDTKKKEKVAIKRMSYIFDEVDAKRLLRELRIMRNIKHKNMLNLKHVICHRNPEFYDFYLVTDLWDTDLSRVINHLSHEMQEEHKQYILYQIFNIMNFLHENKIIHRDFKPSNILVSQDCDICLCDFGFAREIQEQTFDITEYVVTKRYRAPEIMLSSEKYNSKVDIWSLGCIVHELLLGEHLFDPKSYMDLVKLIIKKVGYPDKKTLEKIKNKDAVDYIKQFSKTSRQSNIKNIKYENKDAINLMTKCLEFNPTKRITAKKALAHPYLQKYFKKEDIVTKPVEIDFSFERKKNMTFNKLKVLILEEVNLINKEAGEDLVDVQEYKYFVGIK